MHARKVMATTWVFVVFAVAFVGVLALPHTVAAVACPDLTVSLGRGATDDATGGQVTRLQTFLADLFSLSPSLYVTGFYGALTESNVERFQCEYMELCSGSPESNGYGVVGPKTRAAIARMCEEVTYSGTSMQNSNARPPWYASLPESLQNLFDDRFLSYYLEYIGVSTSGASHSSSCSFHGQTIVHGSSVVAYEHSVGACDIKETRTCRNGSLSGAYEFSACFTSGASNTSSVTGKSCSFHGQIVPHGSGVIAYEFETPPVNASCVPETRACNDGVLSGAFQYQTCIAGSQPPPRSSDACQFDGQTIPSGTNVVAYQASSVPHTSTCVSQVRTCSGGTLTGSYQHASCSVSDPTNPNPTTASGDYSCEFRGISYAEGTERSDIVSGFVVQCQNGQWAQRLVNRHIGPSIQYALLCPHYASLLSGLECPAGMPVSHNIFFVDFLSGTAPHTITVVSNNSVSGKVGMVYPYAINWGDGSQTSISERECDQQTGSCGDTTTHTFNSPGNYTVSYTTSLPGYAPETYAIPVRVD